MNDYISRQAAIRWVKTECNPYGKPTLDFESGKKVIEHLKRMSPADVVPVVRCKDCKHWDNGKLSFECPWDYGRYGSSDEDDFCSYGERKE